MKNLENATEDEMTREFQREQQSNSHRVTSSLDENIRLFLQYMVDNPSHYLTYPMVLEGISDRAVQAGF